MVAVFKAALCPLCAPGPQRLLALGMLLAGLMGCAQSRAQSWQGVVVHVTDGDTVYIRAAPGPGPAVAVRLLGLDAPEICQAGGPAARDALRRWVLLQRVTVEGHGQDSFGRELAQLYLQGLDVGRAMVAQGHAWAERQAEPGPSYEQEQRQARQDRLGLFAQAQPEPPRAFRRRHGPCHPGP